MSPLGVIVAIVLVDLLGFTVVMPLLPQFGKRFGLDGGQIGLLFAAYPLCQLIAGPILGRLSDRYGRRPVLIFSQAGTALSFVMLGLARDYPTMLLARCLDGASGGNILVAQAYVADVTAPKDRARGFGLVGMAFGVGFVLGPLLGGLLLGLPVSDEWRLRIPFLVGAVFSTIAWVLVLTRLPESLPADSRSRERARVLSLHGLAETVARPTIGLLVAVGFLVVLAFASLEGTFSLFLRERLGWDAQRAAFGFVLLGLVSAMVQGGLIRRLAPRFGERRLILVGLVALAMGMALIAGVSGWPSLLLATLVVAFGQGLVGPSLSGLISKATPASEQGAVFGTLSSAQTLARMVSYLSGNILLDRLGSAAPYWQGAAIALVAFVVALAACRGAVATDQGSQEAPVDVGAAA
jgi:DHA1 family tetracycline resistance protein-like MFS transporter